MTLCLALMLLAPGDLPLTLADPEPAATPPPHDDWIIFRARGGVWSSRAFAFEATTTTSQQLSSKEETLASFGVDVGVAVQERLVLLGTVEGNWANNLHSEVAGLGLGWRDWAGPTASAAVPNEVLLYAGLLYGRFAITETGFGDFDDAFGARAGLSMSWKVNRHFYITFAIEYRYLKFDYKDKSDLAAGDRSVGGSGIWAGLGVDIRF